MLAIYAFVLVESNHNHEIGKLLIHKHLVPISGITWATYT